MNAKIIPLNCPNCGGAIELKEGQKIQFCPYCGAKLYFDDGNRNITIKKEEHKTYQNKTKLEEMRLQHQIDLENEKREFWAPIKFLIGVFVVLAIWFIIMMIWYHIGHMN